MEDNALVRVAAEVVVSNRATQPVCGGGLKNIRAEQAQNDVRLAGSAGGMLLGHHAHERAGDDAVKFLKRGSSSY